MIYLSIMNLSREDKTHHGRCKMCLVNKYYGLNSQEHLIRCVNVIKTALYVGGLYITCSL